jgi:hypothetical protein
MTRKKVAEFNFHTQQPTNEPFTRACFRQALAEVAAWAKATLPQTVNGRIEKAVQIVLAGDVELMTDGRAVVGSQSDATLHYVVDGECECPDSDRPELDGWCKHRIAVALQKRAMSLARQQLEAQLDSRQAQPQPALPEAPTSANCYVEIAGRKVQVTLRDLNEEQLLSRMEKLLARFPAEDDTPLPEGWCSIHQVQMTHQKNARGSWWSHKTGEGWCKGK